jgi:adhesin transport system outer membrane protein
LLANQDDLVAMRNETRRSVSNLYSNRDLQQDLINSQALSVGELSEILASYQRQYQSGHKAWQDILNMQRELSEQRLQQVQAENDWLVFTLKLVTLIGGLDSFISNVEE